MSVQSSHDLKSPCNIINDLELVGILRHFGETSLYLPRLEKLGAGFAGFGYCVVKGVDEFDLTINALRVIIAVENGKTYHATRCHSYTVSLLLHQIKNFLMK